MKELNNIENVMMELLAKVLSGEASDQEKAEVESWAGQSAVNQGLLKSGRDIMQKSRLMYQTRKFDPAAAWEKVSREIDRPGREVGKIIPLGNRFFTRRFLRIAASLLLAVLLGSTGFYLGFRQQKTAVFTEVISDERQVLQGITLPDGTIVTLNSNSKLHYPEHFAGRFRKVTVEGEAFFQVIPDASKPFVITAGSAQIKVLGTSFNVSARPGDKTVEVTVETGKVQVQCTALAQQPGSDLILLPGEKGVLLTANNQLTKSVNDNPNVTAWKTRNLVFSNTPLREVFRILGSVYHTDIQVSDPALNELVLTAHFDNQPVEFILEVIRLTFNLELTALNGQYFLTAAKNI